MLLNGMLDSNGLCEEDKGKGAHETEAQTAGAYPGFLSIRHT